MIKLRGRNGGDETGTMRIHERERAPYWWWVAVSAVLAVALTPWVPMTPFSGVLPIWQQWIGDRILGGILVFAQFDGFLTVFLPFSGAFALFLPLLALRLYVAEGARLVGAAAKGVALVLFLLAGLNVASELVPAGTGNIEWEIGRVALTVAIGAAFITYGIALRRTGSRSLLTQTMTTVFIGAGGCLASFVLLPVGGLGLIVAYALLAIVLLQRRA